MYIFFCSVIYDIAEDSNSNEIWRPIITFGHLLEYKKTALYGGNKQFSFWYVNNNHLVGKLIVYQEEVQLSFFCPFRYENYPFDSHVCTLEFGSNSWPTNVLTLKPHNLIYDHVSPPLKHSLAGNPIILRDLPHPFEFEFNFKPTFGKTNTYNFSYSYAGMEIKMKRKSLGKLLSSYYYPMAAFAFLSTISFLIRADVVSTCFYLCSYFHDSKYTA